MLFELFAKFVDANVICPKCFHSLSVLAFTKAQQQQKDGNITCPKCGNLFPLGSKSATPRLRLKEDSNGFSFQIPWAMPSTNLGIAILIGLVGYITYRLKISPEGILMSGTQYRDFNTYFTASPGFSLLFIAVFIKYLVERVNSTFVSVDKSAILVKAVPITLMQKKKIAPEKITEISIRTNGSAGERGPNIRYSVQAICSDGKKILICRTAIKHEADFIAQRTNEFLNLNKSSGIV